MLGVVIIAAAESPTAYRYYRTQYYGDAMESSRRSWRHRRGHGGGSSNGHTPSGAPNERPVLPYPS